MADTSTTPCTSQLTLHETLIASAESALRELREALKEFRLANALEFRARYDTALQALKPWSTSGIIADKHRTDVDTAIMFLEMQMDTLAVHMRTVPRVLIAAPEQTPTVIGESQGI